MRVLQIVHGREAGGIKTLAEVIGGGLEARRVSVETAVLFPGRGLAAKLSGMARVAWRVLTGRYDAILAYQPTASILTGIAGFIARCPRRIVHQTALPGETRPAMRVLDRITGTLGLYTANIVNTRATQAVFANYPARYRAALRLIEHGVAALKPQRSRAATLAAFGIPDARILLNVGRLADQKNQGVLVRALACLPAARLVIAGDGPEHADYTALATTLGVADRLHLLGDVSRQDIADLLAAADVFVFPSVWETFGLAAVEAALAGLPVIAADLPVLREVLTADGTSVAAFVAPRDVEGWVTAITAPRTPARAAVETIARRYAVTRMIDAYAVLLGQTGAERAGALAPRGMGVA